jgi:hypothetical protein
MTHVQFKEWEIDRALAWFVAWGILEVVKDSETATTYRRPKPWCGARVKVVA